jgi:tetratricopeptide (TPR) repeat protein
MQLQIRHIEQAEEPLFEVVRMRDGKHSDSVSIKPPDEDKVGTRNTTLMHDLQWYLEEYLKLPVQGFRPLAEGVQNTLAQWGKNAFTKLFGSGPARDWYQEVRRAGLAGLQIKIASDNPDILAWPWEALESPDDGSLALDCSIERQLCDDLGDANKLADVLPKDKLNILYIVARPYGENDVGFQTLIRPLVDFAYAEGKSWPVHIDLLRPPTLDQLREVLAEKPNFYHIVHFDGHGGYDADGQKNAMGAGALVFENGNNEDGGELVPAKMLGQLLREHNIPVMVLNACRSAMLDEQAETPFATVAASLLKAGIHSVIAMSYSLWVSGAKEFVPAFYRQLFKGGGIAEAMRQGRLQMYSNHTRDSSCGKVDFYDWIVPVLYQQSSSVETILPRLTPNNESKVSKLPGEVLNIGEYGIIGRDSAMLGLERAVQRQTQAGILIHGMSGEGKTTLAKGFLQWLESTNGLGDGVFWFSFENIHSADYVIDDLAGKLLDARTLALPREERLAALVGKLRAGRYFLLWDNFESASGIPGTEVSALIPEEDDRKQLKQLLAELRNGKTKILITSRSVEEWLSVQECFRFPLGGLQGEELWQYCEAVVADLGLKINRDEHFRELLEKLEGNPLAVRAILLRLKDRPAEMLLRELEENFNGVEGDESTKRISAALAVFERGLDKAFAPVLRLLGLHEHFADAVFIGYMLKHTDPDGMAYVDKCFAVLESAGLCRLAGEKEYRLHPALRSCLARLHPAVDADKRAFVDLMSSFADTYSGEELHEQRDVFSLFGANFYRALSLVRDLDMRDDVLALIQALAFYAYNVRNFAEAERLYKELADTAQNYNITKGEAIAYHQLGLVALERWDLDAAEDWCKRSLAITEKQGNEHGMALTYHQLGIVAEKRGDLDAAENWYNQSLAIEKKLGDEHGMARTYHQLGRIKEERRDLDAAEDWYNQALAIEKKLGNKYDMASTYQQLGLVALERWDLDTAENWYNQSLVIEKKLGGEHGMALTYHQLGMIAQERRDFDTAENWYNQSLAIKKKLGDEYGKAGTYHHLGMVAEERGDLDAAEDWYKSSLAITEKQRNEHGMAITYHGLGRVAEKRRDLDAAEDWCKRSLAIEQKQGNEHGMALTYLQLGTVALEREDLDAAEDWCNQAFAIEKKLGNEYDMAKTYFQQGRVTQERGDLDAAEDWYNQALAIEKKLGDEYGMTKTYHQLGRVAEERLDFDAAGDWYKQSLTIFERLNDQHRADIVRKSISRLQTKKSAKPDGSETKV